MVGEFNLCLTLPSVWRKYRKIKKDGVFFNVVLVELSMVQFDSALKFGFTMKNMKENKM